MAVQGDALFTQGQPLPTGAPGEGQVGTAFQESLGASASERRHLSPLRVHRLLWGLIFQLLALS